MTAMATTAGAEAKAINFARKLSLIDRPWSPRVVAEMNDGSPVPLQFKLVKLQGEFVWHAHADTDEAFIVVAGTLAMQFRDRVEIVQAVEMIVVPRGVEHCPRAEGECHVLIVEPRGVVNTGDAGGDRTAANDVWV